MFVFDSQLTGYARTGGVSDHQCFAESLRIVTANFGLLWATLAFTGYCAMKIIPFLRRLRPFREQ